MLLNRDLTNIKKRKMQAGEDVEKAVKDILADVRQNGDSAVRRYCEAFDGFKGDSFLVSEDEIKAAIQNVGEDFMRILERACHQITEFHANQAVKSWGIYKEDGVMMGQIARPLQRAAVYVPGGTASYPSTLLMNGIPAVLAGVPEIVVFTPVKADGKVADVILAAAACCGIHTIYKIGGVQAVAAAAYGTQTIPKADKITGPGNLYVATAKRLVCGEVDIDMVAGPSEVLIIADETADPKYVAADLMSQAEHDVLSSCILVTTCPKLIEETERELERQIEGLSRKEMIRSSLQNYGAAILTKDLNQAFAVSNEIAPEHLEILTKNPMEHLTKVQNAGSIFLGEHTPEPLGDYLSGTNHVLPTNGTARFYSPLGVYDFIKYSTYSYYPREALSHFRDDVIQFAAREGFDAHANAIKVRFEESKQEQKEQG